MLRINVCTSSGGAKRYYAEAQYKEGRNTRLNYYAEKEKSIGKWHGKATEKLGLSNEMRKADFDALCDNKRPDNGKALTGRTNAQRRVGYDFTFNASKSISLAHAFGSKEERQEIETAFSNAVKETMLEVEKEIQARVRTNGANENRVTGNIIYGEFVHYTTRPVKGVPDPHLHTHCFVFNATYDKVEDKWKAGQFGQVKQDASYYQAYFHSKLAEHLQNTGYPVRRTKDGVEMAGISQELIDKFSQRTKEIKAHAKRNNIVDARAKSRIGANTRESKQGAVSERIQLIEWKKRFTIQEMQQIKNLKNSKQSPENKKEKNYAIKAIEYSINHHLERKSVASDKEILATALKQSIGDSNPEQIKNALRGKSNVISVKEGLRTFITTKEALKEEKQLISNANSFRGKYKPVYKDYEFQNKDLNDGQRKAVIQALTMKDGLTIITGKAGAGKTTLMKEVKSGIQLAAKKIYSFAPSADASRNVQVSEGFVDADTVASLIQNRSKHSQYKNQVIWIDEAGLLSNKDMNEVFKIAKDREDVIHRIDLAYSKRFSVYEQKKVNLTTGDRLRITGNGRSLKGRHLFNGNVYSVKGFDKEGNIKLSNDSVLSKNYGHFDNGYVSTSHSSQGKTADKVIIAQSSQSIKASSLEQFYVSVSRGRNAVAIFTDDKQQLMQAVQKTSQRMAAMELTGGRGKYYHMIMNNSHFEKVKNLKEKIGVKIAQTKNKSNELPRPNIKSGRTR